MRVKQTAKKITGENASDTQENTQEVENSDHNSCDNQNDISDNEVEFLVECRRDQEGNQFLLDGTPVIEPAPVTTSNESKENETASKEINFDDFLKEIQDKIPDIVNKVPTVLVTPKRNVNNVCPYTSVKCTACNAKYNPFIGQTLHKHPLMEVILCSSCIQNQKDEYFVIDEEDKKETLCRWCVEGGSLICCDYCPKSFCKTCIKRNLGRTLLSEILDQDDSVQWKCFVCEPKPIESLKATCRKVYNDVRIFVDRRRFQKLAKKTTPKVAEIVNKKRSQSKAFPVDTSNGSGSVSAAKLAKPSPQVSAAIVNNMSSYGTDWYMRNVKLRNIFTDIDEVNPRTLLNAINSTKKCIEAFYSDIRNLEVEISKASTATDIGGIVTMFKSVYRHHIFNRFCQVKSRIEEDKRAKFVALTSQQTTTVPVAATGTVITNHNTISNGCTGKQCTVAAIRNTNSIPSLLINNVVSTAPFINKLNNNSGATVTHTLINGGNVMASIDLTDEPDKMDDDDDDGGDGNNGTRSPTSGTGHQETRQPVVVAEEHTERSTGEIVDLCADDDSRVSTGGCDLVTTSSDHEVSAVRDSGASDEQAAVAREDNGEVALVIDDNHLDQPHTE